MQNEIALSHYEKLPALVEKARAFFGRPLTLTEKVLFAHLDSETEGQAFDRGSSTLHLRPDRVAMQDATAQMAILQFMQSGLDEVQVPSTVHCDHLIRAHVGADEDLETANSENKEVYDFLRSAAARYSMGFWKPGSGIIHQVVLENYAFPGGLMIGTDSHTPNAGGLGMVACGVGGADAVDVMVGMPWTVRCPKLIGVHLKGAPSGWTAPKDVILKLAGILTVAGGTGAIVEYFGEGAAALSCTGKGTITNMGAELGATTSIFPFDNRMADYLRSTGRQDIASAAEGVAAHLQADPECAADPEKFYDRVVEIDLSELKPHLVGPHTPDLARPLDQMKEDVEKNDYPDDLRVALIGSCTNSSYEDIGRAAHIARQAADKGLKAKVPFLVTPGSEQVRATIERDGLLADLEKIGATVLANACGPCIGQWKRDDIEKGERNSIVTSFNRNFQKRNDGNAETLAFIGSPETVTAMALAGRLTFDPSVDALTNDAGEAVKLEEPTAPELPANGWDPGESGFLAPPAERSGVAVEIAPDSERLMVLPPFAEWDGNDLVGARLLVHAEGKCTTDHISPAGPWLRYRGHLDQISNNMFSGAKNKHTGEIGRGTNLLDGEKGLELQQVARAYKAAGVPWIVVGDSNYGEGSSREHAAMEPRWLGCRAVIVRSFARIHETNLKKQGILPLTFVDPADYERFREDDTIDVLGLADLAPGKQVTVVIHHADGSEERIQVQHTLNAQQVEWIHAGSALNIIRKQVKA